MNNVYIDDDEMLVKGIRRKPLAERISARTLLQCEHQAFSILSPLSQRDKTHIGPYIIRPVNTA